MYAALGVPIVEIQYLMRHSSSCVLRYLEGTTLQSLKTAVARALNPGYAFSLDSAAAQSSPDVISAAFVKVGDRVHRIHAVDRNATVCLLAWHLSAKASQHEGPVTCKHCISRGENSDSSSSESE